MSQYLKLKYLGWAIFAVLAIIILIGLAQTSGGEDQLKDFMSSWGLRISYGLLITGTIGVLVLGAVVTIVSRPHTLLKIGIGIGVLVLLYAIGYGMAESTILESYEGSGITEGGSQMIGAMLKMTWILIIGGFIAIAVNEISKMLR